jgi:D-amino-acid dehydrogenase
MRFPPGPALASWAWRFLLASGASTSERAAPILARLLLASRDLWGSLASEPGEGFGLEASGVLMLCRTDAALRHEIELVERGRKLGIEAEVLTAAELAAMEPEMRAAVVGAVRYPQDARLQPSRLRQWLLAELQRVEATVRHGIEATGWRHTASAVSAVRTNRGEVEGDAFLVAAGVWSGHLTRRLGVRLALQPGKGHHLHLDPAPFRAHHAALLNEARVAMTPMGNALRFAGTMELGAWSLEPNAAKVAGIREGVARFFPALDSARLEAAPVWCGLRPCTPDGLPYVGRLRPAPNVLVAAGHAMLGISLSPVTAQIVVETLLGREQGLPVAALDPARSAAARA